jgi:hypothetical protein
MKIYTEWATLDSNRCIFGNFLILAKCIVVKFWIELRNNHRLFYFVFNHFPVTACHLLT